MPTPTLRRTRGGRDEATRRFQRTRPTWVSKRINGIGYSHAESCLSSYKDSYRTLCEETRDVSTQSHFKIEIAVASRDIQDSQANPTSVSIDANR